MKKEKRVKPHYFYADTHVDGKIRAAQSLERLIQELPTDESYKAAHYSNTVLLHTCIYLKDIKKLTTTKEIVARMMKERLYAIVDTKDTHPKVKSFLKNIIHAKFKSDIYNK